MWPGSPTELALPTSTPTLAPSSIPQRDAVVLIVSNNDSKVGILKQYLRDMRCGAMVVDRTARDGLDTLARGEVDVMITRDRLPDADAIAFLQAIRLRARKAKQADAQLVYIVDRRKAAVEVVVQAEPDAILAWPVSFSHFKDRVESALDRARRERASSEVASG